MVNQVGPFTTVLQWLPDSFVDENTYNNMIKVLQDGIASVRRGASVLKKVACNISQ